MWPALARKGYRIRPAVRRPDLAGHLQPLGWSGRSMPMQANLRYPESVEAAVRGADVVINLVGIVFERGKQRFEAVHADGARASPRGCRRGARISTSRRSAPIRPARAPRASKALGEAAVLAARSGCDDLRPSIVFGPGTISSTASPRWRGWRRCCR